MVYSEAWGKRIQEKNQKQKISWHSPFNRLSFCTAGSKNQNLIACPHPDSAFFARAGFRCFSGATKHLDLEFLTSTDPDLQHFASPGPIHIKFYARTETDLQLFAMTDPDLEPFLPGGSRPFNYLKRILIQNQCGFKFTTDLYCTVEASKGCKNEQNAGHNYPHLQLQNIPTSVQRHISNHIKFQIC